MKNSEHLLSTIKLLHVSHHSASVFLLDISLTFCVCETEFAFQGVNQIFPSDHLVCTTARL